MIHESYRFTTDLSAALRSADEALRLAREIECSVVEMIPCHCLWRPNL